MVKTIYDIIVIGAGSAGLTAAIGGAGLGAKVLLIEKEKIGGDCTHHGCVPSKTLIKAGKIARNIREISNYGFGERQNSNFGVDIENILKKVNSTIDSIYQHETPEVIRKCGIDVEIGKAKFIDESTIEVNKKEFSAKKFVIATGSRARNPTIKGTDKISYLTNKEVFDIRKFKSITIVGSGPIGSELSQAFNNLGIEVNLIDRSKQIMGREDFDAASLIQKKLTKEGVNILLNKTTLELKELKGKKILSIKDNKTNKIEEIRSDEILFAIGRVPNIENLGLGVAKVDYDDRGIKINSKTQTSNSKVYAIGDVAGGPQFTHFANHQGKVALTNIIFKLPTNYEAKVIPRVTFTSPEVASVGINEAELKNKNLDYLVLKKNLTEVDRAITDSTTDGFFKIIVDRKGYIKGAVLVGENAGELIGEISLAMKAKVKITTLADTIHPYPTYGYGLRNTADQFRALSFSKTKKNLLKKIMGLRGN